MEESIKSNNNNKLSPTSFENNYS